MIKIRFLTTRMEVSHTDVKWILTTLTQTSLVIPNHFTLVLVSKNYSEDFLFHLLVSLQSSSDNGCLSEFTKLECFTYNSQCTIFTLHYNNQYYPFNIYFLLSILGSEYGNVDSPFWTVANKDSFCFYINDFWVQSMTFHHDFVYVLS